MKWFKVKNFEKYQPSRNGKHAPWIRLYHSWNLDSAIGQLHDSHKAHFIGLLSIAHSENNQIPFDNKWIKKRGLFNSPVKLELFVELGLIEILDDKSEMDGETKIPIEKEKKRKKEKYTPLENKSEIEIAFEEDWNLYPRKAGDKAKALSCYKKTVGKNLEKNHPLFQQKMQAYVQSVEDPRYLQYGETFFKNWENLVVDTVRKNGRAIITPMQQANDGRGEFVDMIIDGFQKIASDNSELTEDAVTQALLQDIEKKDRLAAIKVLKDFQLIEAEVYEPDENNPNRV